MINTTIYVNAVMPPKFVDSQIRHPLKLFTFFLNFQLKPP